MSQIRRRWVAVAVGAVVVGAGAGLRADGPTTAPAATAPAAAEVDNPIYAAWAKVKPGSTATLTTEMTSLVGKAHVTITLTLESVDRGGAKVTAAVKVAVGGKTMTRDPETVTVPAKVKADEAKEAGAEDVEAMGKTFKCRAYELDLAAIGLPAAGGKGPRTATVYLSDDVPGGVVKTVEKADKGGKPRTIVVSAYEAK